MKKLLIVLFLLITSISYSSTYLVKKVSLGETIIYIFCVDGYKFMLARDNNPTSQNSPEIIQMYKSTLGLNTILDTCKNDDKNN
jgi:uncharacterized protein YxeA